MSVAYQIMPTAEKRQKISELLSGYWGNDVWDIRDSFFDDLRPEKWSQPRKTINFSTFSHSIRDKTKYIYAHRLQEKEIRLISVFGYSSVFNRLAAFLNKHYPEISSIVDVSYDKFLLQWRSHLIEKGVRTTENGKLASRYYERVANQLYSFFSDLYDTRDEYEKDIWDCRKISGAKTTENKSKYYLNFTDIPVEFRELVKKFIKFRTTNNSLSQCDTDIMSLRLFTKHIHSKEPSWSDLKMLSRNHMEDYLTWYRGYTTGWKNSHIIYLISLRNFLNHIQSAIYAEAPELPSVCLLLKEDIPKSPQRSEDDVKYIAEGVLQQLEDKRAPYSF